MAKAAYIGIDRLVETYETVTGGERVNITSDNISQYFTVTEGTYTFKSYSENYIFTSSNYDLDDTTARIALKATYDTEVSFDWGVSSESGCDYFEVWVDNTQYTSRSGEDSGSCNISLKAGQTLTFEYIKDDSAYDGEDCAWFKNMVADTSYEYQELVSSEMKGFARKVTSIYVGVDNVARRSHKAYIGIGGVARPFWNDGRLAAYGSITGLDVARDQLAATSVGNYALFAGGYNYGSETFLNTVDAYSISLTKVSVPTILGVKRELAAVTIGGYALFGGGYYHDGTDAYYRSTVCAYDKALTRVAVGNLTEGSYDLGATTVGEYALFAGGRISGASTSRVNAYDRSLTRVSGLSLSALRENMGAATLGDYALFGGGRYYYASSSGTGPTGSVNAFDRSLTRTQPSSLRQSRGQVSATSVGGRALFAGGDFNSGSAIYANIVDVFDKSLSRSTAANLSVDRYDMAAITLGKFALFGGGLGVSSSTRSDVVDTYDASITKRAVYTLPAKCDMLAAAVVGDYALFAGGRATVSGTFGSIDTVYAFTLV